MKPTVEKYREKHQAWALSEIKGTIIVCFQKYLENRSAYIECVHMQSIDPKMAKSNMIASLDAYFQNCQPPFIDFLDAKPNFIMKKAEEAGLTSKDFKDVDELLIRYENLPTAGMSYDHKLLFFMGNILTRWNTEDGYFRMLETSRVYDSEEDKMQAIFDEEEN